MSTVFLDTVGVLALLDSDDQWHNAAENAYATLRNEASPLVTSQEVLLECGNAAARRPYRRDVAELRQALQRTERMLLVTEKDIAEAWLNYEQGFAGNAGIVDHISFVVMKKYGIQQAFTNDKHFESAGFEILF